MASATPVPSTPQTKVAPCSTRIDSRSSACGRKNRRYQSVSSSVADEFRLVEIVLMAAEKMAANRSPFAPAGNWVRMK